jgi:hypothetical protein
MYVRIDLQITIMLKFHVVASGMKRVMFRMNLELMQLPACHFWPPWTDDGLHERA